MQFTKKALRELSKAACQNPRLRMNLDLRTDINDQSQRMLNALEPGTIVPIHRHRNTTETLIVICGRIKELFYNDEGNIIDSIEMSVNGECSVLQIEKGQWHSLECLESGTVVFEAKDGSYAPLSSEDSLSK